MGQAIARFEECANHSRFSSQVRVAPVGMHDRANPAALRVGEQDEVQSVVIAQTQVGDEPVEPPRNQMLARAVKIPSLHHLNLIPARPLNQPAERWIWFDHEHSHHRLTPKSHRHTLRSQPLQLLPRQKVCAGEEFFQRACGRLGLIQIILTTWVAPQHNA